MQTVMVICLIGLACGYLLARGLRFLRSDGCGGSCHCVGNSPNEDAGKYGVRKELIQLGVTKPPSSASEE